MHLMNSEKAMPKHWHKREPKSKATNKELVLERKQCVSCAGCVGLCPTLALDMYGTDLQVFQDDCTYCTLCVRFCPVGALRIETK